MQAQLHVTLREVYGLVKAYPACPQAERLAKLAGTKTLTVAALRLAKEMGFELIYVDRFGAREAWTPEAFALRIAA